MKRKKYNKKFIIMTFASLTLFSFLTILSKHTHESVKPETKTHHSSHSQPPKNSSSDKKTTPKSSKDTSTDNETTNYKEGGKDQASSSIPQSNQKQNGNTPHLEGSEAEPKLSTGGRGWGGPEDGSYAITEGGRGWGGPGDGSYITNRDEGSNQSSSSNGINEWGTNANNNPYEYPQASSSIDTTANSN